MLNLAYRKLTSKYHINKLIDIHENREIGSDLFVHYPDQRPLNKKEASAIGDLIDHKIETKEFKAYVFKKTGIMSTFKRRRKSAT